MGGMNVIGYVSANCGLSVAARTTVRVLSDLGTTVAIADIPLDRDRSDQDRTFDHLRIPDGQTLPHPVNLFHVNPPVMGEILAKRPLWFGTENCFNVGIPFWELPLLPDFWIRELQAMDVILCPSHFIEHTIATELRDLTAPVVRHYAQTVFLPAQHRPDRSRFGLPDEGLLFVMSFEMASDTSRKNPWAVIEAFNSAFASGDNAYLVVKLNNTHLTEGLQHQLERLRDYASVNDHIIIRDEGMPYEAVISFYESCDVYVSLHRSEGLGLGPMEAMLLGKPVIATAWSGNMDFMNDVNSCLVGYKLIPVESPIYRTLLREKQTVWADPKVNEAALWMRRLYEQETLRKTIGTRAHKDMLERQRLCAKGEAFVMTENIYEQKKNFAAASQQQAKTSVSDAQAAFFAKVSELLKSNNSPAAALRLYDEQRASFADTPLMARFDALMRQVRAMAGNGPA